MDRVPHCEPKGRWFDSPCQAHTWVVGQIATWVCVRGKCSMFPSPTLMFLPLSFSLCSPLSKINNYNIQMMYYRIVTLTYIILLTNITSIKSIKFFQKVFLKCGDHQNHCRKIWNVCVWISLHTYWIRISGDGSQEYVYFKALSWVWHFMFESWIIWERTQWTH